MFEIVIENELFARRLIGIYTSKPPVFTGAEIAVMLATLDGTDVKIIENFDRILDLNTTESAYANMVSKMLGDKVLAKKLVNRLKEYGILKMDYQTKKLYTPMEPSPRIKIDKPESFLLFLTPSSFVKWDDSQKAFRVRGGAIGLAFCKSKVDFKIDIALRIAKELANHLEPLAPLKKEYFEMLSFEHYEICESCFLQKSERDFTSTAELCLALHKIYNTKTYRVVLEILKESCNCPHRKTLIVNKALKRKAEEIVKSLPRLKPLKVALHELSNDDSLNFIEMPKAVRINGKQICGLALSLANTIANVDLQEKITLNQLIITLMNLRHLISPDFINALSLLGKILEKKIKIT